MRKKTYMNLVLRLYFCNMYRIARREIIYENRMEH